MIVGNQFEWCRVLFASVRTDVQTPTRCDSNFGEMLFRFCDLFFEINVCRIKKYSDNGAAMRHLQAERVDLLDKFLEIVKMRLGKVSLIDAGAGRSYAANKSRILCVDCLPQQAD